MLGFHIKGVYRVKIVTTEVITTQYYKLNLTRLDAKREGKALISAFLINITQPFLNKNL